MRRDNRGGKLFVDRNLALRRRGYDPRRSGEITPLFFVFQQFFRCVAEATVQSCFSFSHVHFNDVCVELLSITPQVQFLDPVVDVPVVKSVLPKVWLESLPCV